MANPLPNALALASIDDGSAITASPHRSNYAAVQAAVNTLRTCLAGGVSGQLLSAVDGTDVQWITGVPFAAVYRKTTAKVVVNSVVETDLLNGEITVGAGVMSTNRTLRLTASGDLINNTGAAVATPRLKLKLGATTLIDSNVMAAAWVQSAARWPWRLDVLIQNLGAANSQWTDLTLNGTLNPVAASAVPTTGEGIAAVVAASDSWLVRAANSSAVDTTAAQALALTVTLPTANALEDMTLKFAEVTVVS